MMGFGSGRKERIENDPPALDVQHDSAFHRVVLGIVGDLAGHRIQGDPFEGDLHLLGVISARVFDPGEEQVRGVVRETR